MFTNLSNIYIIIAFMQIRFLAFQRSDEFVYNFNESLFVHNFNETKSQNGAAIRASAKL